MTTTEPTPSLAEYRRQAAEDPNAFWRLESGDHENLLDEAIEQIDQLTVHNGVLVTEVRFQAERAEQARACLDKMSAHGVELNKRVAQGVDALAARIEEFAHLQDRIPDTENGEWSLGWDVGYNAALAEVRAMAARPIDFTEDARESATTPPEGDTDA